MQDAVRGLAGDLFHGGEKEQRKRPADGVVAFFVIRCQKPDLIALVDCVMEFPDLSVDDPENYFITVRPVRDQIGQQGPLFYLDRLFFKEDYHKRSLFSCFTAWINVFQGFNDQLLFIQHFRHSFRLPLSARKQALFYFIKDPETPV